MKRTDKKLFALLMTLIMVVSLLSVGAFAADSHACSDCKSTNCTVLGDQDADCHYEGFVLYRCSDCGNTDTVKLPATGNHNFVNGTCTECGMWETPAEEHIHSFTKKVISAEYATGESGVYYYSCECGEKGTVTFNQDGSTGGGIVEEHPENPDCTHPDLVIIPNSYEVCFDCGYSKQYGTEGTECEHNYEVVKEEPATCAAPAYVWEKCSLCGDEKNGESGTVSTTHGETRTDTVLPTCVNTGVTQEICKVCNEVLSEEILPTNDEHVYLNGKCLLCGEDEIPCAHENTRLDIIEASCVKEGSSTKICKDCGETVSEEVLPTNDAHAFHDGKCLLCGADEVTACEHDYVVVKELAPSCVEAGYVWMECSICGAELNHESGEPNGIHDYVVMKEQAGTCSVPGYVWKECSVCGYEKNHETSVDADAHDYVVVKELAGTCSVPGYVWKECSVCGYETNHETTIDAEAHGETRLDIVEPTCAKEGVSKVICKGCDEVLSEEVLPVNDNHVYHDGKCLLCGADEVTACEHNYVVVKELTPSCTEAGYVWMECSICGNEKNHESGEATGHSEVVLDAVDPICEAAGLTEGSKCETCGVVLVEQEEIAALGHTEKVVPAVAATCEATGLTKGKVCSVCDEVLTAQESVAKLGHKWDAGKVTKEPSATAKGEKLYTCLNDGTHTYTTEIAATGTASNDGLDDVPKTGDASGIFMFGGMMIVALFGAIVTFFSAKKRNNH